MQRVIRNDSKNITYYRGRMIPVGESIIVEEPDAPDAAAAPENNALGVLQSSPVKIIAAGIPDLTDDDLTQLEALESAAAAPRKGVLAAIADERLKRADLKNGGEGAAA